MSERLQIYRCPLCGQVVEVLSGGSGELVCCGKPMLLLDEHTAALDPKTAAMVMAIVADKMGKPINELRFISIKEVSQ